MVTVQSGAGAVTTTGPGQRRRSGNGKYFISENISVLKIFQAGNLVLDINPGLLVIVEGLEFAGTVEGARERPIQLSRQVLKIFHCYEYLISENISEPAGLLWSHVSLLVGLDPPLPRV